MFQVAAGRAADVGHAGAESAGSAGVRLCMIMSWFGTGHRPRVSKAPARPQRPHHEAVRSKAEVVEGVFAFGACAPQPMLAADGHGCHVACWRKRRANRAHC